MCIGIILLCHQCMCIENIENSLTACVSCVLGYVAMTIDILCIPRDVLMHAYCLLGYQSYAMHTYSHMQIVVSACVLSLLGDMCYCMCMCMSLILVV